MRQLQYAVYLIPPPELLVPTRIAQQVLGAQFGTRVASSFMVHCTVKGFFKLAETASLEDFVPALDALYERTRPFETELERLFLTAPRPSGIRRHRRREADDDRGEDHKD